MWREIWFRHYPLVVISDDIPRGFSVGVKWEVEEDQIYDLIRN